MILVASASKPLSYTVKKTARRGVILKDYNEEIEAIYRAVEDSSNTNIPIPSGSSSDGGWTLEESLKFVRDVVHSIMTGAESLGDEDDFFGFGCDRWVIWIKYLWSSKVFICDLFAVCKRLTYVTHCFTRCARLRLPPTSARFLPMSYINTLLLVAWQRSPLKCLVLSPLLRTPILKRREKNVCSNS